MEQACHVCGQSKENPKMVEDKTVLVICDNCLKGEELSPLLDQFLLP